MVIDASTVITAVSVLTSVGVVQLVIFLIKRKSELSALDRTSSKPLLEEQGAFIDRVVAAETKASLRVAELEIELKRRSDEFIINLERVTEQNRRLVHEVSSLRTDVDVARLQLDSLRRRLNLAPDAMPRDDDAGI